MTAPHRTLELFVDRITSRTRLSPDERAGIAALPVTFEVCDPGQRLVKAGDVVDRTCLVADGLVGRSGRTHGGAEQLSALYIPGDMPDLHSFVMPQATWDLVGLARSTVARVPHVAIADLIERFPRVGAAFWRDCTTDAAMTVEWLLNIARRDALGRTAHLLCEMAIRYRKIGWFGGSRYELPLTQRQLADALGMTNVHVSRTLTKLRERGAATFAYGTVHVLDWPLLAEIGEFEDGYLQF